MSSQPWATWRNTKLNKLLALPCTDSCYGLHTAVWAHCLSNMWLDVDVLWLSSGTFCLLLLKNRQYTGGDGHGSCGSTLYLPFLFLNRLMWFHFHPSLLRSLCLQIYHRYKWDSCLKNCLIMLFCNPINFYGPVMFFFFNFQNVSFHLTLGMKYNGVT